MSPIRFNKYVCGHCEPDIMWYYFQIPTLFFLPHFELNINQLIKLVLIINCFATY